MILSLPSRTPSKVHCGWGCAVSSYKSYNPPPYQSPNSSFNVLIIIIIIIIKVPYFNVEESMKKEGERSSKFRGALKAFKQGRRQ